MPESAPVRAPVVSAFRSGGVKAFQVDYPPPLRSPGNYLTLGRRGTYRPLVTNVALFKGKALQGKRSVQCSPSVTGVRRGYEEKDEEGDEKYSRT